MLVYFVHHVSSSIQASHIVSTISDNMQTAIPKLYPSRLGQSEAQQQPLPDLQTGESWDIQIATNGYIQSINLEKLLEIAKTSNAFLELKQKPGDHVVSGATVVRVWRAMALDEKSVTQIRNGFLIGPESTLIRTFDISFSS